MSNAFRELQKLCLYVGPSGVYIYLKAAYEVMMNQNQYNAEPVWVNKVLVGARKIYREIYASRQPIKLTH